MSELRKLAEAALSLNEPWWDLGDARVSTSFCDQDAAYIAAANPATVIGLMDEIDRLRTEAVAADIRIANDALVIAGLTAVREPLSDKQISRMWSEAHNDTSDRMAFQVLARAIEAALRAKP